MATRVYADDANLTVDPFLYKLSVARAEEIVLEGRGEFKTGPGGRRVVQLLPDPGELKIRGTRSSVLLFARFLDPLQKPPSIPYPTPPAGYAFEQARFDRRQIHATARSAFARAVISGALQLEATA